MPQLQNLYESILEGHLDRRNFSNKMLHLGILEDTGDRPSTASNRIPIRYRFNKESYDAMKAKGFRLDFNYLGGTWCKQVYRSLFLKHINDDLYKDMQIN